MYRRTSLLAFVPLLLLAACAPPPSSQPGDTAPPEPAPLAAPAHLVDLTHTFGEDTLYWPTDTHGFGHEMLFAGPTEKGYYYSAGRFSGAEHGGTHLDAPIHFWEGGAAADAIPLERLVAPGVVVDVSERAVSDADTQVQVADFEAWEAEHGRLAEGVIVLLRTGFSARWPDRAAYLGTAKLGEEAIPELHFPGLHPAAATWLKDQRQIAAIGIDTASIDYGQSTHFESHVTLFSAGIPAFENVAHLDRLPAKDFLVVALPMKIQGGSGGPLRIVAMW